MSLVCRHKRVRASSIGLYLGVAACLLGCTASVGSGGGDTPPVGGAGGGIVVVPPGGSSGGGGEALVMIPTPRLARLSHAQLALTLRDLLRLDTAPRLSLARDSYDHFDNSVTELEIAEGLRGDYELMAEDLAAQVARNPAALARITPANLPQDAAAAGRAFVEAFGRRAFRRPLSAAEVDAYAALYALGPQSSPGTSAFAQGVELVLRAFLQSPNFLYRAELSTGPIENGLVRLGDHELASKLAYALTNTMPDDALFAAADAGALARDRAEVERQARRLLDSGGADAALDHFHGQHLHMYAYEAVVDKSRTLFPEFTPAMGAAMRTEGLMWARDLVRSGGGVADVFTSRRTFVNQDLARLYGLSGVSGSQFSRVELDADQRAGFLTRLGFLAHGADPMDPNPIERGKIVNLTLLCREGLKPPSGVAGMVRLRMPNETNRRYYDEITGAPACAACHRTVINPPGYALEGYDALGKVRTTDRGEPIATAVEFNLGEETITVDGGVDLSRQLAQKRVVHDCMSKAWVGFLLGLSERPVFDATLADQALRAAKAEAEADAAKVHDFLATLSGTLGGRSLGGGAAIKDMILSLVTSDVFLTRLP